MTYKIALGDRFGNLVVKRIESRGADKPRRAFCICDCGKLHDADVPRLIHGQTVRCQRCAAEPWQNEQEAHVRRQFSNYRNGATRRGYDHRLSLDEFRAIYLSDCAYCGQSPARGIDRRDNNVGYLIVNCAPCCKHCNLAKRDMSEADFFTWVCRIAIKQGFSL